MKDSGSAWLRDIPDDWKVIKLKYIFGIIGGNGFPEQMQGKTEGDFPFCKVSDINSNSIFVDSAVNYVSTDEVESNRFNIIPVNSIIMAKIGAALMKNHRKINSIPCCIDNNTQALVPKKECNILYLFYLMKCIDMKWFDNNSTIPSVNNTKLMDFIVPWICAEEQSRIADYLDQQCAHIDAVIEKTKASIEEYKKLKQAVITQAVTKGICGDRPMKDSGIEWIGEIPADWDCRKLRSLCVTISKGTTPKDISTDFSDIYRIRFIKSENIVNNVLEEKPLFTITSDVHEGELRRSQLSVQDILFVIAGASIGKVAIVKDSILPANTNQATSFIRINKKYMYSQKYVWYVLQSRLIKEYIASFAVQSAQPNISMEDLGAFKINMPKDINETKELVEYLDEKCSAIDMLIEKKEQTLTEMESYKKSLIYEYVTGKKEVPQSCQ